MKRDWDMDQVSDGKRYTKDDFVKVGCKDCAGCHSCCVGMDGLIVLDPYDVYRLTGGLGKSMKELLEGKIELRLVDGVVLPCLSMDKASGKCVYLNGQGRCEIHESRPGICRLFPLGRIYRNDGGFDYFLQVGQCDCQEPTMERISSWLSQPNLGKYEKYITRWHGFLGRWKERFATVDEGLQKQMTMYLVMQFFTKPYDTEEDFFAEFSRRLQEGEILCKEL